MNGSSESFLPETQSHPAMFRNPPLIFYASKDEDNDEDVAPVTKESNHDVVAVEESRYRSACHPRLKRRRRNSTSPVMYLCGDEDEDDDEDENGSCQLNVDHNHERPLRKYTVPEFLIQLKNLLTDKKFSHVIEWKIAFTEPPPLPSSVSSTDQLTSLSQPQKQGRIQVHQPQLLEFMVLPQFFPRSIHQLASFQQQMYLFGFRKQYTSSSDQSHHTMYSPCQYLHAELTENIESLLQIKRANYRPNRLDAVTAAFHYARKLEQRKQQQPDHLTTNQPPLQTNQAIEHPRQSINGIDAASLPAPREHKPPWQAVLIGGPFMSDPSQQQNHSLQQALNVKKVKLVISNLTQQLHAKQSQQKQQLVASHQAQRSQLVQTLIQQQSRQQEQLKNQQEKERKRLLQTHAEQTQQLARQQQQERRSQQQFLPLIRQQEEQEQNLMQMHLNQWQEFEQWTQQQWQLMEQQQEQARERGQVQRLAQRRQPESREIEQHCRAAPHDRQHGKSSWHGKQSVLPNEDGKDDPSQRQTLRELQKRKESVIVSSSLANRLLEKTRGDP